MDKMVRWEWRMPMIQQWNKDILAEIAAAAEDEDENEDSQIDDNIAAENPLNSVAWN